MDSFYDNNEEVFPLTENGNEQLGFLENNEQTINGDNSELVCNIDNMEENEVYNNVGENPSSDFLIPQDSRGFEKVITCDDENENNEEKKIFKLETEDDTKEETSANSDECKEQNSVEDSTIETFTVLDEIEQNTEKHSSVCEQSHKFKVTEESDHNADTEKETESNVSTVVEKNDEFDAKIFDGTESEGCPYTDLEREQFLKELEETLSSDYAKNILNKAARKITDPYPYRHYLSYDAVTSKYLAYKWKNAEKIKFHDRLSHIKPAVDNKPPPNRRHVHTKLKLHFSNQVRQKDIENSNKKLYERIRKIVKTDTQNSHLDKVFNQKNHLFAFAGEKRRIKEKLDSENDRLLIKLEEKKSAYENRKFLNERLTTVNYLKNISGYPASFINEYERLTILKKNSKNFNKLPIRQNSTSVLDNCNVHFNQRGQEAAKIDYSKLLLKKELDLPTLLPKIKTADVKKTDKYSGATIQRENSPIENVRTLEVQATVDKFDSEIEKSCDDDGVCNNAFYESKRNENDEESQFVIDTKEIDQNFSQNGLNENHIDKKVCSITEFQGVGDLNQENAEEPLILDNSQLNEILKEKGMMLTEKNGHNVEGEEIDAPINSEEIHYSNKISTEEQDCSELQKEDESENQLTLDLEKEIEFEHEDNAFEEYIEEERDDNNASQVNEVSNKTDEEAETNFDHDDFFS
ncbi:hypothetical protein HDU92_001797 [Lobulomyces angularis]|nr:hypothetical protein HDU92_001797 [Lobulomyces angularis]